MFSDAEIKKHEQHNRVTYAIFGAVILFGEVITVSDDQSPAPHVHLPTYSQIVVLIKVLMDSSCLQEKDRLMKGKSGVQKTQALKVFTHSKAISSTTLPGFGNLGAGIYPHLATAALVSSSTDVGSGPVFQLIPE